MREPSPRSATLSLVPYVAQDLRHIMFRSSEDKYGQDYAHHMRLP